MERVDAALATLLPLVLGVTYFRFCPEDVRCGIELDEIDPEQWALLEVSRSCVRARYTLSMQQPALFVHSSREVCSMAPRQPAAEQKHTEEECAAL